MRPYEAAMMWLPSITDGQAFSIRSPNSAALAPSNLAASPLCGYKRPD